jgi:hypothetical protein
MKSMFEKKKMQRNALLTFLSGTALVYGAALYYSYKTDRTEVVLMLLGTVVFLAVLLFFTFRKGK